jgi:integrase
MKKKNMAAKTMKHAKTVMSVAFKKALRDKIIVENPVTEIEIPSKQAKPHKTFIAEELSKLFYSLKTSRRYWCYKFILVTGLRRGEVLALKWSNIDYKNKKIIVFESNSSTGLGDTKSSKVHHVPLCDRAVYYLEMQRQTLENEINPILHNKEFMKSDLIFPTKNGTMMNPGSFRNVISRAGEKVGVHASPHMFRHTFVYMSKGLLTIPELQEALGHDEATTTTDIYGTMLGDTEKVANKIETAFSELDDEIQRIKKTEIKEKNIVS